MAKTSYAIKRLAKYGAVEHLEGSGLYTCTFNEVVIQFYDQDGEAICIRAHRVDERDDPYTDYFAGSYYDNISQAINRALAEWTLCHREPCPACGSDLGTKRWIDGRTVWTCHKCGRPISGKYQKPKPTPAAQLGSQENQPGLLPIGSRVHYTGDMANQPGEGWVGSHMPSIRFGGAGLNIELDDGRVFAGVYSSNLRWPHEENRGQRFVIRQVARTFEDKASETAAAPDEPLAECSAEVQTKPKPRLVLLGLN